MRILLHACCGPCLLEPYDALASGDEVAVCFANPNIAPRDEYLRRRDTLVHYAESVAIEWFETAYEPERWIEATAGLDRPERCGACYALRLDLTAAEAAARGFDAVATTLSVSPYQDIEAIDAIGRQACARHGVRYLATDFRERYPDATRRSRELGMYRQNYCGCLPSIAEAEADRQARREARKAARAARNTSGG